MVAAEDRDGRRLTKGKPEYLSTMTSQSFPLQWKMSTPRACMGKDAGGEGVTVVEGLEGRKDWHVWHPATMSSMSLDMPGQ